MATSFVRCLIIGLTIIPTASLLFGPIYRSRGGILSRGATATTSLCHQAQIQSSSVDAETHATGTPPSSAESLPALSIATGRNKLDCDLHPRQINSETSWDKTISDFDSILPTPTRSPTICFNNDYDSKRIDIKRSFYSNYPNHIPSKYQMFITDFLLKCSSDALGGVDLCNDPLVSFGIVTRYYTAMKNYPNTDQVFLICLVSC